MICKSNMHHDLAQKLCEVLGKLRQLFGGRTPPQTLYRALPLVPTGGLRPSECVIFMCPQF